MERRASLMEYLERPSSAVLSKENSHSSRNSNKENASLLNTAQVNLGRGNDHLNKDLNLLEMNSVTSPGFSEEILYALKVNLPLSGLESPEIPNQKDYIFTEGPFIDELSQRSDPRMCQMTFRRPDSLNDSYNVILASPQPTNIENSESEFNSIVLVKCKRLEEENYELRIQIDILRKQKEIGVSHEFQELTDEANTIMQRILKRDELMSVVNSQVETAEKEINLLKGNVGEIKVDEATVNFPFISLLGKYRTQLEELQETYRQTQLHYSKTNKTANIYEKKTLELELSLLTSRITSLSRRIDKYSQRR